MAGSIGRSFNGPLSFHSPSKGLQEIANDRYVHRAVDRCHRTEADQGVSGGAGQRGADQSVYKGSYI
ncbi:hypothetical protein J1614_006969 [Plenodomus biglobosus]|nr:hypothetical protein J1614_006969 [Plenodomus biglobosus]